MCAVGKMLNNPKIIYCPEGLSESVDFYFRMSGKKQ
jgi:hypothetical protein